MFPSSMKEPRMRECDLVVSVDATTLCPFISHEQRDPIELKLTAGLGVESLDLDARMCVG